MMPYMVVCTYMIDADRFLKIPIGMNGFLATYSWCKANTISPAVQMKSGTSVRHEFQGHSTPPRVMGIRNPVVDVRKRLIPTQSNSFIFAIRATLVLSNFKNIAIDIPPIQMNGMLIQKIQRHKASLAKPPPGFRHVNGTLGS